MMSYKLKQKPEEIDLIELIYKELFSKRIEDQ